MRFAKDALIGLGLDTALPGSRRSYEESQNMPTAPSFNADDLEMTPEMAPGPFFSGQDLMRDKYIRENPRSGIARLHGGEELQAFNPLSILKMRVLKEAIDGQPLNPGTIMSPKMEQEIYEPGQMVTPSITSPIDREVMKLYKSGFV
jgi:hypothetical protein